MIGELCCKGAFLNVNKDIMFPGFPDFMPFKGKIGVLQGMITYNPLVAWN